MSAKQHRFNTHKNSSANKLRIIINKAKSNQTDHKPQIPKKTKQ